MSDNELFQPLGGNEMPRFAGPGTMMRFPAAADAAGLRKMMLQVERITDQWERASGRQFDEETKVGKLRELIPNNIWKFKAQEERTAN